MEDPKYNSPGIWAEIDKLPVDFLRHWSQFIQSCFFVFFNGTLHEFAYHPCAGAMLIFSVSFQF